MASTSKAARVFTQTGSGTNLQNPISPVPLSMSQAPPASSSSTPIQSGKATFRAQQAEQPTTEELAKLGIKVRDFAYESTLPPITPYRRLPRQIQPSLGSLKRARESQNESDDDNASSQQGTSGEGETKKSKLERWPTEPVIQDKRSKGFGDINPYDPSTTSNSYLLVGSSQPSEYTTPPNSQPPLTDSQSQESELYIRTPLVTPKGTLQWPVEATSHVPTSQLETSSQAAEPEPFSLSRLDLVPKEGSSHRETTPALTEASSPLSSPPSSLSSIHGQTASASGSRAPSQSTSSQHANPSTSSLGRPRSSSPAPRYHLRKRIVNPSTPTLTRNQTRHRRSHAQLPSPRSIAFTVQSAHSRSKSRSKQTSTGSKPIRRSTNETTGLEASVIIR